MRNQVVASASRKAARIMALILIIATVFSVVAVSASAYEVKGKTISEVLGMDGAVYYRWLKTHEKDKYYNTTPYAHADHRNPNGDCQGANGSLDTPGVPAMNCMGFVWHVLYMPTKMSGGKTGLIPAYGKGGWYGLYTNNKITRRYFSSKTELLRSGYAEAGDIIWCFVENEHISNDQNHICVYMGDGHSDRVWHAVGAGCVFGPIRTGYKQYIVLKSGVIPKLDTPVLKSVKNTVRGAKITWKAVGGAYGYSVFVKNGSKWKKLGDTRKNEYIDKTAQSGRQYTYTVRCISRDGKYISEYNKKGISNTFYAAPGGFYAECADNRITFSWKAVDGAAKYRVYRRTAGKSWELVAKTAGTVFVDTNVQPAKMYLYTVRAVNSKEETVSDFRDPLMGYILNGMPQITGASVGSKGVLLNWNDVRGAEQYLVCKKVGAGWKRIGVSKTNSFLVTTPDPNVVSTYTVRCLSSTGNAVTSRFDPEGYAVMYQTVPQMTSLEARDNGVRLTWSAQDNAEMYRVYRKGDSDKWAVIADVNENTYVDTTALPGNTYTYTLRSVSADGKKNYSFYEPNGWSITYINAPVVTASAADDGIHIAWNQDKAAAAYRVYVKKDGKWTTAANTKKDSFLYTDVVNDTEYTFTVRAIDASKHFNSFYDVNGASATYIDPNAAADDDLPADTGLHPAAETEPADDAVLSAAE